MVNHSSPQIPATVSGWVKLGCVLAVVGAATASGLSLRVPVAYQATVKVQPSWRLAGAVVTVDSVDQFAAGLAGRLKSTANLSSVVTKLKLPYGTATLSSNLSIVGDRTNYQEIDVIATDSSPVRASEVANAVVAAYIGESHSKSETIWVDEASVPPGSPVRPLPQLEALTGGLVGCLLAVSLLYALRRFEPLLTQDPASHGGPVRKLLPASRLERRVWETGLLGASTASLIVATGASGAFSNPALALAAFAPLVLLAIIFSPVSRLAIIVVGGLLVFQSSQELTAGKVTYFLAVAASALVSALSVWKLRRDPAVERLRWLLYASGGLVLLLAISFVVALSHSVGALPWARDVAPYGLIALAALLAVDVSASRPSRAVLELLLIGCGVASALAYANYWLLQREYGSLPVSVPVLESFLLPAALVVYATAQVIAGRRRAFWIAVAVAVCFLLFVTGSRATLLILVGPIAVAVFAGPLSPVSTAQRLISGLVPVATAGVLTAGFLFVSSAIPATNSPIGLAIASATSPAHVASPVSQSSSVTNSPAARSSQLFAGALNTPQPLQAKLIAERFSKILLIMHDPSFAERRTVDRLALDTFAHYPLFGIGPGHVYQWPTPGVQIKRSTYLDSGLSLLAKFGLSALPVMVIFVTGLARVIRDKGLALTQRAALVGYCSIVIAWMAVEAPLEDKGLGLALALLLVLTMSGRVTKLDRRQEPAVTGLVKRAAPVQSKVLLPV